MKIGLANDHRAYNVKEELKSLLDDYEIIDYGCFSNDMVDYPKYAITLATAVVNKDVDLGIVMCGTGIGVSIAANKVNGVRAAVCSDATTAHLVKEHNNANIIAFGARIVGLETAKDIVKSYLDAEFMGGRHQTRIDMIHEIEKRNK